MCVGNCMNESAIKYLLLLQVLFENILKVA